MDSNNQLPKPGMIIPVDKVPNHVQVEEAKRTLAPKPTKQYLILHLEDPQKEGSPAVYDIFSTVEEAFLKVLDLKQKGHTRIRTFQEIQLKISMS